MKKVIIITILLVTLLGLGVYESMLSYKTYSSILEHSSALLTVLQQEDFNEEKVKNEYDKIEEKWNKYKPFALAFSNHIAIKDFTQKLHTVRGYIDENDKKESYVAMLSLKATTESLLRENIPLLENIL